jgi:pyrroline-5-carboxylate reductase
MRKIGIIGGEGELGGALIQALLRNGRCTAGDLMICGRSQKEHLGDGTATTASAQKLADMCEVVILAVPPAAFSTLAFQTSGLVISVMAGVTLEQIMHKSGSRRAVRAMCGPLAVDQDLGFATWCASAGLTAEDRNRVNQVFVSGGQVAEVDDEAQIDFFTALNGPVPGMLGLVADMLIREAMSRGIAGHIAVRAVKAQMEASGQIMANADFDIAAYVQGMIRYDGTTAAAFTSLETGGLQPVLAGAFDAAITRATELADFSG